MALSLQDLPNKIHIVGHTDALPYKGSHFTNWELSADRAAEKRRYLMERKPSLQVKALTGKSDTELYVREHSESPLNRRISILVLSDFQKENQELGSGLEKKSETSNTQSLSSSQGKEIPEILQIQEIH